ncbi:hypothetical protein PG999_010100 [Apiospora kogelbergensis]|uniref:Aromatic amino acid beta-eliminating lyase/threonine aldolase domain-containing protein n=1 Tax=Apiospora kogelbergensis TaxID=1337665 RepID=A0AAW0QTX6_9PEZI
METTSSSHPSHWGHPVESGTAFDFRSDATTTPSIGVLQAVIRSTLNDDVYGEDETTQSFEEQVARICGMEAAAFVITGTMANQLALRALLWQPPHAVLMDAQAHVVNFEAAGLAHLSGALAQPVKSANGHFLTVDDIKKHAVLSDRLEKCPTKVISIDNTAHGNPVPIEELRLIKGWASSHGISVHIDGARLWHAVAAGAGNVRDIAACCDALALCFSKGLGAPMGGMVLGSSDLVHRVKRLRQSVGGGVRKVGMLAAAARQALMENFGPGDSDVRGILQQTHQVAKLIADMWTTRGGLLLRRVETNMVWLNLHNSGLERQALNDASKRHGIKVSAPRIVVHHQISGDALRSLELVFDEVLRSTIKAKIPETPHL